MPLAHLLICLHFLQTCTMTSPHTATPSKPASSRGGNRRAAATLLRIPGPSSSSSSSSSSSFPPPPAEEDREGRALIESAHRQAGKELDLDGDDAEDVPSGARASTERENDVNDDEQKSSSPSQAVCRGEISSQSDLRSTESKPSGVDSGSRSDLRRHTTEESSSLSNHTHQSTGQHQQQQAAAVTSLQGADIVPVLKRKDSPRDGRRTSSSTSSSRTVSLSEPPENSPDSILRQDSKTSSVSSAFSDDSCRSVTDLDSSTATTTSTVSVVPKRRISFPADSVLTAVIQDGDTAELLRILTGRHGPGLVQSRGEGGAARGVDVRQSNHVGLTALHHAVLANNLDAAKLLLCHGADVNAQDVHGFSPLHTAAACGFLPITSLLLLFGADVFAQTLELELPIDVAKELRIVRVLSEEMTRLVHQELWVASVLRARAEELWLVLRKLLALLLLLVLQVCVGVRTAWRKRRRHRHHDRKTD